MLKKGKMEKQVVGCPREPRGLQTLLSFCESEPVVGGCALLGEEVWMRAFAKGTTEVEPAFLFVWDAASLCSAVTQNRKANKGIFRWSLRAFSFVFPCKERQPVWVL